MTDDDNLDARIRERYRQERNDRIRKQGFEVTGLEPETSDTCSRSRTKQVSPRKQITEPCGNRSIIVLDFRAPHNPEGVLVPLCRSCLVHMITKDLMFYLED